MESKLSMESKWLIPFQPYYRLIQPFGLHANPRW